MVKFLPTSGFKWIDPKEFDLDNILAIVRKDVFSNLILNILESYENYTMIIYQHQIKQKSKEKCCPTINLKISDLYNILIANVKKLVPNFFDNKKYVVHYENLQLHLRLGLKLKKYIEFQNSVNLNG